MPELYISTCAFRGEGIEDVVRIAEANDLSLEFSSGLPYRRNMKEIFLGAAIPRLAHNYFPAPRVPFVLNLASADDQIRAASIAHCVSGIRLSTAVAAPFYSAHAGLCVDPQPSELGRRLELGSAPVRQVHWELFVESVREVLSRTSDSRTMFLIENNVLVQANRFGDGTSPALCVEPSEILGLLADVADSRLAILLDTAHLKVSAATLGFDPFEAARRIMSSARCVHHSDNDGTADTNGPLGDGYWFLPLMRHATHAASVIEVVAQSISSLKEQSRLLSSNQT